MLVMMAAVMTCTIVGALTIYACNLIYNKIWKKFWFILIPAKDTYEK